MKKIIAILALGGNTIFANAQSGYQNAEYNEEVFRTCAMIFVFLSIMVFILSFLKRILEHRLKNKIVDKGIDETAAFSILKTNTGENKHTYIKWFALLAGAGVGLMIIHYNQPMGIHSIATIAFSLAISFLGYFIYLKKSGD